MPRRAPRRDLAAMVVPLGRALVAAEEAVLAEHDLSMWGYIVLSALADEVPPSQAVLARRIGADKTRIIPVLDDLERDGLIDRRPDPADRRARVLSLTARGRTLHSRVRAQIQRGEERWLRALAADEREVFLRSLETLSDLGRR